MKTATLNRTTKPNRTSTINRWLDMEDLEYGLTVSEEAAEARVSPQGSYPGNAVDEYVSPFNFGISRDRLERCDFLPRQLDEAIVMSAIIRNHLLGDPIEMSELVRNYLVRNTECLVEMIYKGLISDEEIENLLPYFAKTSDCNIMTLLKYFVKT